MSYCKEEGKDKIIFLTPEDLSQPSSVHLPEDEEPPGLILPNGEINWGCPCLGGMATGPCGVEFREAFSCFHFSKAEPKGSDCYDSFKTMQECMSQYPSIYGGADDDKKKQEQEETSQKEAEVETTEQKSDTSLTNTSTATS